MWVELSVYLVDVSQVYGVVEINVRRLLFWWMCLKCTVLVEMWGSSTTVASSQALS